jgi:hypothetical protein
VARALQGSRFVANGDAQREVNFLGRNLQHVWAVALRLFLTLAALEIAYLALANVTLLTPLLRKLAKSDDILVRYDWAYSLWPGHIVVRNLNVRVEDHNIQFLVGVERGSLDVSLHELLGKRFHALRVDADNVSYRMRHKVSRVGTEGPRLAAYPPIEGFSDPPLFEGPPSPEIPDGDYHLWDVRIEDVTAKVKEIWILEYRYRGPGLARGNFHVQPARWYEVYPASLELDGGELSLGTAIVAEKANATIDCRVDGSDPRKLDGLAPFHNIHAGVRGRFEGMELGFLDAYLGPHAGLSATGTANVLLDARIERGVVAPGTRIEIESPDASIGNESVRVEGAASYRLFVPPDELGTPLVLGLKSERLVIDAPKTRHAPPSVEHIDATWTVSSDFTRPLELLLADVPRLTLRVPDLGWFSALDHDLPKLRGAGNVELDGQRNEQRAWSGSFRATADPVRVDSRKLDFAGAVRAEARFGTAPDTSNVTVSHLRLEVPSAVLEIAGARTRPWSALLTSEEIELRPDDEAKRVRGSLSVHTDDASALLPLVVDSPFARTLEKALLGLQALDAKTAFSVGETSRFELLRARAGIAKARGMLSLTREGPSGAFLVSTGPANVGVRVRSGETRVDLFVGNDWLDKQLSRHVP